MEKKKEAKENGGLLIFMVLESQGDVRIKLVGSIFVLSTELIVSFHFTF